MPPRPLRPRLRTAELPVVEQENCGADDHRGKDDEGPRVEMKPEDRIAVRAGVRNDVQQDLPHGHRRPERCAQYDHAIMARSRAEDEIESKAEARGNEACPLQDA